MRPYTGGELMMVGIQDPKTGIWHAAWGQVITDDGMLCPCHYGLCGSRIDHPSVVEWPPNFHDNPSEIRNTLRRLYPTAQACNECMEKAAGFR